MLKTLIIHNYVLIDHLVLDFHPNFTAITGETGAGKSILLGAIALLMGQRADLSLLRPGSDKCIIEAHFGNVDATIRQLLASEDIDGEDEDLIIRREISAKGKSRAFVNDTPASLVLLKSLSEYLIDIHSQHKNLLLGDAHFQLSVLDLFCNNAELREQYAEAYRERNKLKRELEEARRLAADALKEQDFLQFQYEQLEEASLKDGELERLEEEERQLSHALDIKSALASSFAALDDDDRGALLALSAAADALSSIRRYWSAAEELYDRLQSTRLELRDISDTLSSCEGDIEYDPERLSSISQRLDQLNTLLSKHNKQNIAQLIELREEIADKLEGINNSDIQIQELESRLERATQTLRELAAALSQTRRSAAQDIEQLLISGLVDLGMPHVRFAINLEEAPQFTPTGCDVVTYLFSANKEINLEPVADIASGGEISRLMLCIKALIADRRHLPTIIFDEIDTGVSGDIAERIGIILQSMGKNMQVMAVTHLPQIAASGVKHLYIYKEHSDSSTLSHIRYLEQSERVEEIARMQSGNNLTDITLAAANELLNNAQKRLQ